MNWSSDTSAHRAVEAFEYPAVPVVTEPNAFASLPPVSPDPSRESIAADNLRRDVERLAREQYEQKLARERTAVLENIREFASERKRYFAKVEMEVVELALGIARKVLQREAQIDPLFLAGSVRLALDKIQEGTPVRLHVPRQHAAAWRALIEQNAAHLACSVVVEPDDTLAAENCIVRSQLGSVELGMESQLREIERSLLDRIAADSGAGA